MKIKTESGLIQRGNRKFMPGAVSREVSTIYDPAVTNKLPIILFITSFPPRECGIATYSKDLLNAIENKFSLSFQIKICALESDNEQHQYTPEVTYKLNTDHPDDYRELANAINIDSAISMVLVQHEFGFFNSNKVAFLVLLESINKPVVIAYHTVLPDPGSELKSNVCMISDIATTIIVMTQTSANILVSDYNISKSKIRVIQHGTHLVRNADKSLLKQIYNQSGKLILSTFGLLSSGKSIETTLDALPAIIKAFPNVAFLIIGKTHPSVVKQEGESYRELLETKVDQLNLRDHVQFHNYFMPLPELLEYLQLTDIYLFTSKDQNQAVSGTFSYAISCGCPIISTPIPHAKEVLRNDAGITFDFGNAVQLSGAVVKLLNSKEQRTSISTNGLQRMSSTAWENSAIAHAILFNEIVDSGIPLSFNIPSVNLDHLKDLTTDFGMIQFSKLNHPDISSGYTLDDNARALIAMCQHYERTSDITDIEYINVYLSFIKYCFQPEGYFLNYVDANKSFTDQNQSTNIADSNGRAIWALGYVLSLSNLLPRVLIEQAKELIYSALPNISKIHSTRAMAFAIKGFYYANLTSPSEKFNNTINELSTRLAKMYNHESDKEWQWFESYLTYANSIIPEAMLCAWLTTGDAQYREIALQSFEFLLSKTFVENRINVVSNKTWLHKGQLLNSHTSGGQQPIDVAYTILALSTFYTVFHKKEYLDKMTESFNWFLGGNHLNQIIYNPCTGGCYDGLECQNVNLNQGAESTVSYLMARLAMDKVITDFSDPVVQTIIDGEPFTMGV